MRTLTPQRRAAAICGACAAIIPSSSVLMHSHPSSNPIQFIGGMMIGLAMTISVGTFIKNGRRTCN